MKPESNDEFAACIIDVVRRESQNVTVQAAITSARMSCAISIEVVWRIEDTSENGTRKVL
jgi:hypothetical protein